MRTNPLAEYLSEVIDFGGEPMTRAQAFREMEKDGISRRGAELWMLGYDTSRRSSPRAPGRGA